MKIVKFIFIISFLVYIPFSKTLPYAEELSQLSISLQRLDALNQNILTLQRLNQVLDLAIQQSGLKLKGGAANIGGYLFTGFISNDGTSLLQGESIHGKIRLSDLYNAEIKKEEDKIKAIKSELVKNYKIHLMPNSINDLVKIFMILAQNLVKDEQLRKSLSEMKVKSNVNFNSIESLKTSITQYDEILPIIVFYPEWQKENAEYVLNTFIKIFKDIPGAGITPRYNKKINNLIYYAQGDSDFKTDNYKEYYSPDRIFYRSDFEEEGTEKDYSLKIEEQV